MTYPLWFFGVLLASALVAVSLLIADDARRWQRSFLESAKRFDWRFLGGLCGFVLVVLALVAGVRVLLFGA